MEEGNLYSITQANEVESQNKDDKFPLLNNNSDKKPYITIKKKERINRNKNANETEQIYDNSILINEKHINSKILEKNMNDKIDFQEMKKNKTIDEEKYFIFKNKNQARNKGIIKTKTNQNEMPVSESQKYIKNINILKYLDNGNGNDIINNRVENKEFNGENEENYKFNNSINNKSINNINEINNEGSDNNKENKYHKISSMNGPIKYEKLRSLTESDNYANKKLYSSLDINEGYKRIGNDSGSNEDKNKILYTEKIQDLGNKEEKTVINEYAYNSRFGMLNKRSKKIGINEMDFLI